MFDLTNESSFESVQDWLREVNKLNNKSVIILLGTKNDLKDYYQVKNEQIEELIKKYEISYFETSAKTGENMDVIFQAICDLVLTKNMDIKCKETQNSAIIKPGSTKSSINIMSCCKN